MVLGFEIRNGRRNGDEGEMNMKMGDNKGGMKNYRCTLYINPPNSSLPAWKACFAGDIARPTSRSAKLTLTIRWNTKRV